ncbi:EUKARYOTIC TRANSLATION INITIATION FACTOR 3 SUBUNIT G [Salix koriyanagi]|uniref:EUKARYOTIC TRANSLATION INITIATION FACTOR 3 SUBUNIT G n=1 Tax=Salix koriyanagi TaxID=2511006 RepID=A0A9Q0X395_9ROSI|nr:EUKARYOTIC TRANSLATION INITIATION FACTOR 3 SUBUNIT G [Salix koriyanagi]
MGKKRKPTSKPQQSSSSKQPKIEKTPQPPPPSSESEVVVEEEEEEEEEDSSSSETGSEESESEEEEESESEEEEEESKSESEEEEEEEEESKSESEEEETEDSKRETISKLLQPCTKEDLIKILKEAASTDPSTKPLISVFKKYGEIEDCKIVNDKATGRSKGYGFLLFKTRIAARKALKEPQKKVGNRMVSCQLASLGKGQNQKQDNSSDVSLRKLYIGNVGPQISVENLKEFFAQFGEIEDGPSGFDKSTRKFRGFAFIVYKSLEGSRKALEEPVKFFEGIKLQCSLSTKNSSGGGGGANVVEASSAGNSAGIVQGNMGIQGLLNQGMMGQSMNPTGAVFLGQNPALGVLNPMLGLGVGVGAGGMLNQTGLSPLFPGGVSQPLNRVGNAGPSIGLGAGFPTQHGVNTISNSMIGSYNSQAALQGLGAYQSSQSSLPSASAARSQPGIGSVPSYFGR